MDYNKAFETLVGIGLDDYPGSDYSLIEEYFPPYSKYSNYISGKAPQSHCLGSLRRWKSSPLTTSTIE